MIQQSVLIYKPVRYQDHPDKVLNIKWKIVVFSVLVKMIQVKMIKIFIRSLVNKEKIVIKNK